MVISYLYLTYGLLIYVRLLHQGVVLHVPEFQLVHLESLNMGQIQAAIVRTVHNATNAAVFYSNSFIYSLQFSQLLENNTCSLSCSVRARNKLKFISLSARHQRKHQYCGDYLSLWSEIIIPMISLLC